MSSSRSSKSQPKSKASKKSQPTSPQLPPSLASELLMMQFMGGGSIERNAKRMMEQQARDTAPAGPHYFVNPDQHRRRKSKPSKGTPLPVGQAYRDEKGNMWWDENEAAEYKGLLASAHAEPTRTQDCTAYDPFGATSPTSTTFSASGFPQSHYVTPTSDAFYPSYAYPGAMPYHSQAPPRRHSSSVRPSGGFEDSFAPPVPSPVLPPGYAPHSHGDAMMKKKTGMNLRGRARALFGGH